MGERRIDKVLGKLGRFLGVGDKQPPEVIREKHGFSLIARNDHIPPRPPKGGGPPGRNGGGYTPPAA